LGFIPLVDNDYLPSLRRHIHTVPIRNVIAVLWRA